MNAANKNKRLSIERFAFAANELVLIICAATKFFLRGAPNTAAHSPVKKQFYDGKSWKVFSLSARSAL